MAAEVGPCVRFCCAVLAALFRLSTGLGVLAGLPDDVILGLLELLSAADLARLGLVSKALYCFAHTNDLWKALVLQVGGAVGGGAGRRFEKGRVRGGGKMVRVVRG